MIKPSESLKGHNSQLCDFQMTQRILLVVLSMSVREKDPSSTPRITPTTKLPPVNHYENKQELKKNKRPNFD